ncbi:hypothetical protein VKT23_008858 [Stygiomarasmius scandens]|uniref:Cysteine-rich transmembrane CYSTM domain-containing protein n=1 Tax=Marasmiellus scandens TaxID=2682957 RepID=A0ABR1JKD4_9AGAR
MNTKESFTLPSLPPTAHHPSDARQRSTVAEQPIASSGMAISPPNDQRREQNEEEGPARIRGGCFPLPNGGCCYIIPIPCCC